MLMIAAALEEELKVGMALCPRKYRVLNGKIHLWQASRNGRAMAFLKTGVGPKRSAANLAEALRSIPCTRLLVVGYAGALDPELRLGDLVAVEKAMAFSLGKLKPHWDRVKLDGACDLAEAKKLARTAASAGLRIRTGDILTSAHVLGDPEHKRILFEKFHASVVDMETAALARVAAENGVPVGCVRAISDEAADSFLAAFSYDPSLHVPGRARKLAGTGMRQIYRKWKSNTAAARKSLAQFMEIYL